MLVSLCWLLLAPTRLLLALRRLVATLGLLVASGAAGVAYSLWGLGLLLRRGPVATFRRRPRPRPPPGLLDPALGEHRFLTLQDSGLRLHYVTKGPPQGPLLLLLHGFPQTWYCWRHLLAELSGSHQVVALDLPGCGASGKPRGRERYRPELLVRELCQAIEQLRGRPGAGGGGAGAAPRPVTLVGHDWGGLLAWEVACSRPELLHSLVLLAAPRRGAMAAFTLCHPSQLLRSSYVFLFQLPWLPELLLSLADFELVRAVLTSPWLGVQNPARRLKEEEVEVYLYSLAQPGGLSPPIHYYRNLFRDSPTPQEPPPLPTLLLWGSLDAFLDPRLAAALGRGLRPGACVQLLPGAGHWLPEDQPQALARSIEAFLAAAAARGRPAAGRQRQPAAGTAGTGEGQPGGAPGGRGKGSRGEGGVSSTQEGQQQHP